MLNASSRHVLSTPHQAFSSPSSSPPSPYQDSLNTFATIQYRIYSARKLTEAYWQTVNCIVLDFLTIWISWCWEVRISAIRCRKRKSDFQNLGRPGSFRISRYLKWFKLPLGYGKLFPFILSHFQIQNYELVQDLVAGQSLPVAHRVSSYSFSSRPWCL